MPNDAPYSSVSRTAWALDAAAAAFAATTGALLVFGRASGGTLAPFARVGRRVARDVSLAYWGDATIGLIVHLGEALILGALTAALLGPGNLRARLRAALIVTLLWELAPVLEPLAAVRADVAADLSSAGRLAIALLLLAALTFGPRPRA